MEKNPHHLVMGELTDFLTGETRPDTHDERFRQKIAQHLIQVCKFDKSDIETRRPVIIQARDKKASLRIDFLVRAGEKTGMMIRYAPGSLVTRRLPNLALSRIIHPYQIPVVVTTNGEDAEIINGLTGRVTDQGIDAIPDKQALTALRDQKSFPLITEALFEKASRIAYACEVDGACPCDTDVCIQNLENN
ncbi:MAG: type I restriction enzyme HsdR N-terminal domain-containing protein [Desulfotignum sp.]|nr:type I restriction enzyme HsdR N-terminal domain-containing protein [Desulfotignum sp.]MCF8113221.1 type I restriction enzyme HsdR N-terminal domain-containing protein [Desulfotignum sp.]MCF8126337.1 type I restriction enzyme HsdR N-terminal domain-containing protein [Desulfotignum sp.]